MASSYSRRGFLGLSAAGAATTLSACGFSGAAPFTYDLMAVAVENEARRSFARTVLITEPTVIDTYDSERIVVREPGGILSYLPEAQWSDRLPALIQARMVQSFEDRGVTNIARQGDRVDIEVALGTDIRAFELDTRQGALAVVTLSERLVDERDRDIIATRSFSAQTPVASLEAPAVVAALDASLRDVINQIIVWSTATV